MSSGFPFIGLVHNFINSDNKDHVLGAVRAHVQVKHALGTPNYPNPSQKFPVGITVRMIRKMLIWKIKGMSKPSAFFTDSGAAIVKPTIVKTIVN